MPEIKKPGDTRPFLVPSPDQPGRTAVTRPVPVRSVRPASPGETAPVSRQDPFLTEGMKAHRRDVERRKRAAALERLRHEEEVADASALFRRRLFWAVFLGILGFAYWRVQILHGNEWPMMETWVTIVVCLGAGFSWILWYFNKADY